MTKFPFNALELDAHPDGDRIKETIKLAVQLATEDRIYEQNAFNLDWERDNIASDARYAFGKCEDLILDLSSVEDDELRDELTDAVNDIKLAIDDLEGSAVDVCNAAEAGFDNSNSDIEAHADDTLRTHRLI